jgi:hypothetical protein
MTAHSTEPRKPYPSRLPVSVMSWAEKEAKGRQVSFNQVIIDSLKDLMTLFGLPKVLEERLQADRKRLKLSEREYVRQLLTERAEALGK